MRRRSFIQLAATASTIGCKSGAVAPQYNVVTPFKAAEHPGMPGPYRGAVVRVRAGKSIDESSEKVDAAVVRDMLSRGMRELTGRAKDRDGWAQFFGPKDVVGIKVNCSGAPGIYSTPEIVAGIVENLTAAGVPAGQIFIYERFFEQLDSVHYSRYVPADVHIEAVEVPRGSLLEYDPRVHVDVNFFGEEDTRSSMVRLVSERFTKVINVPNMKDHGAAGVTGCLKNIAYGNFSNVARSHKNEKTHTLSFIGTLASVEPLRSRTVLHIMDGLRGIWHGGPFSRDRRFHFYPKQILFGTDPVAMDRLLLDVIEEKRKSERAISVWDRSVHRTSNSWSNDPNVNRFIREPGHIEYASHLGLGIYDLKQIRVKEVAV